MRLRVERALVGGIGSAESFGDFAIDVRYGLQNALAEILGLVAVAQFDGFVFAGGGAAGDNGPGVGSAIEKNLGFNRGVAAGVQHLASADIGDAGNGHECVLILLDFETLLVLVERRLAASRLRKAKL